MFDGYYSDEEFLNKVDESATFDEDTTIYAKYLELKNYEEFQYYIRDDYAHIFKCESDDFFVAIPKEIDGYTVSSVCDNALDGLLISELYLPETVTCIGENQILKDLKILYYAGSSEKYEELFGCKEIIGELTEVVCDFDGVFVEGKISNITYDDGVADIELVFDKCYRDCYVSVDVFASSDSEALSYSTTENIDAYTETKSIQLSVTPDNNTYEVEIHFWKMDADEEYCEKSISSFLAQKEENNFLYIINDDSSVEIVGYSGDETEITIPYYIEDYVVKSISDYAFENCSITSVYIDNNIEEIGVGAFKNCSNLQGVFVNEENQFYYTYNDALYSYENNSLILFPSGKGGNFKVKEGTSIIGAYSFYKSLASSIIIPKSVLSIEENAIVENENLSKIYYYGNEDEWNKISGYDGIDNNVEVIFDGISEIENAVEINNLYVEYYNDNLTVHYYFDSCLVECNAVINFYDVVDNTLVKTFTDKVEADTTYKTTTIPFSADDKNYQISVQFFDDDGNEEYSDEYDLFFTAEKTRYEEDSFVYVINEDSTAEIKMYTGSDDEIVIPDTLGGYNVSSVGDWAFWGNDFIKKVTLGNNIVSLGEAAFGKCKLLTEIDTANNANFSFKDGVLYNIDMSELICYLDSNISNSFAIPENVKHISARAFSENEILTSVSFPEGLLTIEDGAFEFTLLDSVEFPSTLKTIGEGAFAGTNISSVVIPQNVANIEKLAFAYCDNLTQITVDKNNTYYFDIDGCVYRYIDDAFLIYPSGKSGEYTIKDGTRLIANGSFDGTAIEKIYIPSSVVSIDNGSIDWCSNLTTICYDGTASQWNLIEKNLDYNYSLANAEILFKSDSDKVVASIQSCSYSDNMIVATVSLNSIKQDCRCILSIYDEDGRLIGLEDKAVSTTDTSITMTYTTVKTYDKINVKIMFWDSLSSLKPLCSAIAKSL